MRTGTIVTSTVFALVMGIGAGELMYRSPICRDAIGRVFGRGELMALVNERAIYESDVTAEMATDRYLSGSQTNVNSQDVVLKRLATNEVLRDASHREGRAAVPDAELHYEFDLLRHEFGDDKLWTTRMANSGISAESLSQQLRENLAGRRLIEREITNGSAANDDSVRAYYAQHFAEFAQPMRLRASHIFLAAPPETPPEVVEAKQKLIDSLATRLRDGEDFQALVWEESEDEASKARGGDIGYFSRWRVPQDIFAKVSQLKVGETSKPFRSGLGFHIVRGTEIKPARQMTLEEVRSEIASRLTNQRRREAVAAFATRLSGSSALRRGWFWN